MYRLQNHTKKGFKMYLDVIW